MHFTKVEHCYKILKLCLICGVIKKSDVIHIVGITDGVLLNDRFKDLLEHEYIKQDFSCMPKDIQFYRIATLGTYFVDVYENLATHCKHIDENLLITKTHFGDLMNNEDCEKIKNIVSKRNAYQA